MKSRFNVWSLPRLIDFGLRDYGTASWDGGDPACGHNVRQDPRIESSTLGGGKGTTGHQREGYSRECARCGARRVDRQIGLEPTLAEYIATLVAVFRDVRRVLRDDGTVWLNMGDSYAGGGRGGHSDGINGTPPQGIGNYYPRSSAELKPKDLMMVPARVAIALQDDGWWLRSDIIWAKKNCMPESVTDRPTSSHEHIFLLTKRSRYYYDSEAVREEAEPSSIARINQATFDQQTGGPKDYRNGVNGSRSMRQTLENFAANPGRNQRNVWHLATEPFSGWTETSRQVRVEADEADDDTMRTPSPDCRVHVWTGHSGPIRVGDERAAEKPNRTPGNGSHRALAQSSGFGSIAMNHEAGSSLDSSDLPLLQCADSATDRSNQTNRTDRALATNQPCMPSDGTHGHIDDTSASPAFAVPHHDTSASSISTDDSGAHPEHHMSADTVRTSSELRSSAPCTCSYHKTVTESISHFATFPSEIPRRCIKAGSRVGDTVLDPFLGSGTTLLVADQLGRHGVGIELNLEYARMAERRIRGDAPMFASVAAD